MWTLALLFFFFFLRLITLRSRYTNVVEIGNAVVLRQEKHLVGGSCIMVWWCSPGVRQNIQNILRVRSKIHHLDFYTMK